MAKTKSASFEAPRREIRDLPVADIIPTPDNPRVVDEKGEAFLELVQSVKGQGVLVPVLVRKHPKKKGKWDLRYGERRTRAARAAGLKTVPAIVRELTDEEAFDLTFTENYAREGLSPIEEGNAVTTLIEKYGGDVKAVAAKLGHTVRWVHMRAKIAKLIPEWKKRAQDEPDLTAGHLAIIARLPKVIQKDAVDRLRHCSHQTVAWLEEHVNDEYIHALAKAPWDIQDATLVKKAGACSACKKRSSQGGQAELWHDEDEDLNKADCCLDGNCWESKADAYLVNAHKRLAAEHKNLVCIQTEYACWDTAQQLKKTYGQVIGRYGYEPARHGAKQKGARPALVVHGPGKGELRWVVLENNAASSGASPRAKGTPTPLKERRKALECKRWFETLKLIAAEIELLALPELPFANEDIEVELIRLAAAFGTSKKERYRSDGKSWPTLGSYRKDDRTAIDMPYRSACELWEQVRDVLVMRLEYSGPITQTPAKATDEGKAIAKLCGVDWKPLYEKACEVYKEPKSWAKLNADGTPKAAATKKKPIVKRTAKAKQEMEKKADQ